MNLRNLERVLAREEEVKKRAVVHKAVYRGPQIQYLSKNGKPFLMTSQYVVFFRWQNLDYYYFLFSTADE